MTTAVFPGSFDPFHKGHFYVAKTCAELFDNLIVGVLNNPEKKYMYSATDRVRMIQKSFSNEKNEVAVDVTAYDGFFVDFVEETGADCVIRGVRNINDFKTEEMQIGYNTLFGLKKPTLLVATPKDPELINSTTVRSLVGLKNWESKMGALVPKGTLDVMLKCYLD